MSGMTATIVAIVSACVAAAFAVYAWRTAEQERRRSDARVAALSDAIDPPRREGPPPIFGHVPATGLHPLLKIAGGFGTVVAVIVIVAMTTDALERNRKPNPQAAVPAAVPADAPPVELETMNHVHQGDVLIVSGIVRNISNRDTARLSAEITAFGPNGTLVARGRAPIEAAVLHAGQSSRFNIRLEAVRTVGRYRVSFQDSAGVVRHVDARDRGTQEAAGHTPAASRAATTPAGF